MSNQQEETTSEPISQAFQTFFNSLDGSVRISATTVEAQSVSATTIGAQSVSATTVDAQSVELGVDENNAVEIKGQIKNNVPSAKFTKKGRHQ